MNATYDTIPKDRQGKATRFDSMHASHDFLGRSKLLKNNNNRRAYVCVFFVLWFDYCMLLCCWIVCFVLLLDSRFDLIYDDQITIYLFFVQYTVLDYYCVTKSQRAFFITCALFRIDEIFSYSCIFLLYCCCVAVCAWFRLRNVTSTVEDEMPFSHWIKTWADRCFCYSFKQKKSIIIYLLCYAGRYFYLFICSWLGFYYTTFVLW